MQNSPPIYPNQFQPQRPIYDENSEAISFRTYISKPSATYNLFDQRNIIAQTKLYRWVKREFVNGVPIGELHQYLFWDLPKVSKRHLGSTVLQAVPYNPRKMKGRTKNNPRACWMYKFSNPKDLEYGLEWMICIWLRRVTLANNRKEVDEALTELTDANDSDLVGLFWEPMTQPIVRETIREFDWTSLWNQHELVIQKPHKTVKPRPVLRSLM